MNTGQPVIFLVDDDASFLAAVSRLLRAGGYTVKAFASANEFVSASIPDSPGCIIADLHMPKMNGLEFQDALDQASDDFLCRYSLTGRVSDVRCDPAAERS